MSINIIIFLCFSSNNLDWFLLVAHSKEKTSDVVSSMGTAAVIVVIADIHQITSIKNHLGHVRNIIIIIG